MIVIIDYGMGNLRSAQKGIEKAGFEAIVSEDPADIERAAGVVLPGVGAFKDCYDGLAAGGFVEPILAAVAAQKPLLGICVGMQLLFDESEEGAGSKGLGLIPGKVVRFESAKTTGLKVPHMGWNTITPRPGSDCPLVAHLAKPMANPMSKPAYVYFVHSYHPVPARQEFVAATTVYGREFASVVCRGRVFGTQFHPEKSQSVGIELLRAFGTYVFSTTDASAIRT